MSYAADVKRELTMVSGDHCCKIAELSALFRSNGEIFLSNSGLTLDYHTQNPTIAKRVVSLIKDVYGVHVELITKKVKTLNKRNTYIVRINERLSEINAELMLLDGLSVNQHVPEELVQKECDMRAYLRGIFISSGSVNNPKTSQYHLELLLKEEVHAIEVQRLMNEFSLHAKMITRSKGYMIYLKEAEKISDFLKLIEAYGSVMKFEDIRIYRDISNSVNRMNNCDIANQRKAMHAAEKQIEDIEVIETHLGLDQIPEKLREAALLRKEYPDASVVELIYILEEETSHLISKSGMNHRFRGIREIADKLRG